MANKFEKNEYTIPRGRVYFDPFDAADQLTGERYLGNCPAVTLSIATEKAAHYSSEVGVSTKDADRIVRIDRTGKVTCDNMNSDNRALFISGTKSNVSQTSGSVTDEEITVVPGRFYQLGRSAANPAGARNVSAVTVKDAAGATPYEMGTDYTVDAALGRLQVLADGVIPAGKIVVGYSRPAATWERIQSSSNAEVRGALRVISDLAEGANRDTYLPVVTLTPSGDLSLVTSENNYAQVEFALEVLTPANGPAIYVDGRPVA